MKIDGRSAHPVPDEERHHERPENSPEQELRLGALKFKLLAFVALMGVVALLAWWMYESSLGI